MGNTGLMLNVITPLQKFSKGGTTISDVVRQRFQDLFEREISQETLAQVENVYTGKKEDRIKLQQVTILSELFEDSEEGKFVSSAMSEVVTNSKVSYSITELLNHLITQSPNHSIIHLITQSFNHSITQPFNHSITYHLITQSLIQSPNHSIIQLLIQLFNYSFT
jgi:hypothetical protein